MGRDRGSYSPNADWNQRKHSCNLAFYPLNTKSKAKFPPQKPFFFIKRLYKALPRHLIIFQIYQEYFESDRARERESAHEQS